MFERDDVEGISQQLLDVERLGEIMALLAVPVLGIFLLFVCTKFPLPTASVDAFLATGKSRSRTQLGRRWRCRHQIRNRRRRLQYAELDDEETRTITMISKSTPQPT